MGDWKRTKEQLILLLLWAIYVVILVVKNILSDELMKQNIYEENTKCNFTLIYCYKKFYNKMFLFTPITSNVIILLSFMLNEQ